MRLTALLVEVRGKITFIWVLPFMEIQGGVLLGFKALKS